MEAKKSYGPGWETPRPTTVEELRNCVRATVPVASLTEANAAGAIGTTRRQAYVLAERGELPTIHLGRRIMVPVEPLLRMLGATDNGSSTDNADGAV